MKKYLLSVVCLVQMMFLGGAVRAQNTGSCDPVPLPYQTTFYTSDSLPDCWDLYDEPNSVTWALLPRLDQQLYHLRLSFYAAADSAEAGLWVAAVSGEGDSLVVLRLDSLSVGPGSPQYVEHSFNQDPMLSAFADYRIAIGVTGLAAVRLDSLVVDTCVCEPRMRTISVYVDQPGLGHVVINGVDTTQLEVAKGDTAWLRAEAFAGGRFAGWADGLADSVRYVLADLEDISLQAHFEAAEDTGSNTGIRRLDSQLSSVRVQPNPFGDRLTIQMPDGAELPAWAELYDISGAMLMRQQVSASGTELNTSALPAGTYLLRLTTPSASDIRQVVKR